VHLNKAALEEATMPGLMNRLTPKVVSARTHGVMDYVHAGLNFAAAALLRNTNRRASKAAFAIGTGVLANALLTDYPLGVFRVYSFRMHGAVDYGIAAASTSMPRLLGIEDEPEARFFTWQGTGEGVIAAMTDYRDATGSRRRGRSLRDWRRAA
jgi:hypothetical protein